MLLWRTFLYSHRNFGDRTIVACHYGSLVLGFDRKKYPAFPAAVRHDSRLLTGFFNWILALGSRIWEMQAEVTEAMTKAGLATTAAGHRHSKKQGAFYSFKYLLFNQAQMLFMQNWRNRLAVRHLRINWFPRPHNYDPDILSQYSVPFAHTYFHLISPIT